MPLAVHRGQRTVVVQMGALVKARRGATATVPLFCWHWAKIRPNARGWDLMGFAEQAQA